MCNKKHSFTNPAFTSWAAARLNTRQWRKKLPRERGMRRKKRHYHTNPNEPAARNSSEFFTPAS